MPFSFPPNHPLRAAKANCLHIKTVEHKNWPPLHKEHTKGGPSELFAKATLAMAHISISNNIFSFDVVRQSEKKRKKKHPFAKKDR
jgi:hypothetical protein